MRCWQLPRREIVDLPFSPRSMTGGLNEEKIPLTDAHPIRLNLIAGLASSPQPVVAAARIEPTVTPPFDAIEEHVGSVYRYALRLAGRPELAEDLTQETLLRGWKSRHKLRDERAVLVWLLRIATNLWTDHLRRGRFCAAQLGERAALPSPIAGRVER